MSSDKVEKKSKKSTKEDGDKKKKKKDKKVKDEAKVEKEEKKSKKSKSTKADKAAAAAPVVDTPAMIVKKTVVVKKKAVDPFDDKDWRAAVVAVEKWESESDKKGVMGLLVPLFRAGIEQTRVVYSHGNPKKAGTKRKTADGKKRMSGYTLFVKEEGRSFKSDPKITDGKERNTDRMTKLGARWNKLSEDGKGEWNARALALNSSNGLSTPVKKAKKVDTPASPAAVVADDDEEEEDEEAEEGDDE